MNTKPRFEKVDANTIKIIVEKANDVPYFQILDNEKKLFAQKKQIEEALKNIAEIKAEAKKLGIVAKAPVGKKVGEALPPVKK